MKTFGQRALEFYKNLPMPQLREADVSFLNPYDGETQRYIVSFLDKFYNDQNRRVLVFGINPGRLGGGATGVNFTDPVALQEACGIPNSLPKKRELSSDFIYRVAEKIGGPKKLFSLVYFTALCPFGLVKNGKNFNYYDDRNVESDLKSFIVDCVRKQMSFGASTKVAVVIGSGANAKIFHGLNREFGFFKDVLVLEHPRFIMQYKRRQLDRYVEKYIEVFGSVKA